MDFHSAGPEDMESITLPLASVVERTNEFVIEPVFGFWRFCTLNVTVAEVERRRRRRAGKPPDIVIVRFDEVYVQVIAELSDADVLAHVGALPTTVT